MNFQFNCNIFVIKNVNVFLRYSSMKIKTLYHFVICNIMNFIQKNFNKKWKFDIKKSINFVSKLFYIFELNVRIEIINTIIKIFNNETFKQINQLEIHNYKQCENAKFEKFSTKYDNLNKFRNVSFFVVRFAINFVCVFHICRRCKQFFDFDNLFHKSFIYCNRNIKFRDVVRDLIVFLKRF